jgi:hypothetical protein
MREPKNGRILMNVQVKKIVSYIKILGTEAPADAHGSDFWPKNLPAAPDICRGSVHSADPKPWWIATSGRDGRSKCGFRRDE